ncbi:MAG: alpha/beta hydrolase [Hyphomonadaceae bacterium]|nr:alpha/beta hydrolase [Hyphomonadaceae bacterium]
MSDVHWLDGPHGRRLAYRHTPGQSGRSFVWLSGFNSDMAGTKVTELETWAVAAGHGFTAFDYSGHGQSDGAFEDGTITDWHEDSLAVLDEITRGPLILVGSSMGGWMSLLAQRARPARIAGLVLIAPAPDFTIRLMWPDLPQVAKEAIERLGKWMMPSPYGEPVPITKAMIESGRRHLVMDEPITFEGPVRILQGMCDEDVPWRHAEALVDLVTSQDLTFTLIKDGDHRLSRPQDIARLLATCAEIADA